MEGKIKKIQTAIFTKKIKIEDEYQKSKLLLDAKDNVSGIFDGEPIQIPAPSDAPEDIPRMILNSRDRRYACNISLSRTDIIGGFQNSNELVDNDDLFNDHIKKSLSVVEFLKKAVSVEVIRIGFVVNADFSSDNPVDFLRDNFFDGDKFKDTKELSFRHNKIDKIDELSGRGINNILMVSAKKDNDTVGIIFDINTLVEDMNKEPLNDSDYAKVLDCALKKFKNEVSEFNKF